MKKLQRLFLFTGAAAMLAFASCKKDDTGTDDTNKTVADVKIDEFSVLPTGITSFPVGEGIVLHTVCSGNADNALKSLKLTMTVTIMGVPVVLDSTFTLSGTSYSRYDTIVFEEHAAVYSLKADLSGEKGTAQTSTVYTFKTNTIEKDQPFLGNQADTKAKFWSAKRKNTYFLADVKGSAELQADMDFAYCSRSSANGNNKLIAPNSDDATAIYADQWSAADEKITAWTVRNNTGFIKANTKIDLTAFNNDALDTDSLIEVAKTVGEPSNPSVTVTSGDIFLFRTVKGTTAHPVYFYGLVYVATATGTVPSGTATPGDAQLIVRYQREQ